MVIAPGFMAAGGWVTDIFEPQRREGRKGLYFFHDQVNDHEKLHTIQDRVSCGCRCPAVTCFMSYLAYFAS
ncbi:MAG: hypothetical protein AVO38_07990 [delta proteobacterium ML8_D]|nr:MAG: hypothetical protein AVO38_07990 [delta proteobacterium ML8_D]